MGRSMKNNTKQLKHTKPFNKMNERLGMLQLSNTQ
jgi:hypothetical protein